MPDESTWETGVEVDGTGVEVGGTAVPVGVKVGDGVGVLVGVGVGVGGAQSIVTRSSLAFSVWSAAIVTEVYVLQVATRVRVTVRESRSLSASSELVWMVTTVVPWPLTFAMPESSHLPETWIPLWTTQLVTVRVLPARSESIINWPSSSSALTVIVTGEPGANRGELAITPETSASAGQE